MATNNQIGAGVLSIGGGLLLLAAMLIPVVATAVNPAAGAAANATAPACSTTPVDYYALKDGKEVPYAFGPPVAQTDQNSILTELHSRRCADPALTASHEAEWGLVSYTAPAINAEVQKLSNDRSYWANQIGAMEKLESDSGKSMEPVAAGQASLYMVPDGAGAVTIHQGTTSQDGTAMVFANPNGTTVKLRLDCGFQPVRPPGGFPPGIPPTPVTPPTSTPTPTPTPTPVCVYDSSLPPESPLCHQPKDRANDTTPPQGTVPLGPDPVEPVAPAAPAVPLNPASPPHVDKGPDVPVQGATPAPAPIVPPATDPPNNPAPTDPGTPIVDPG